MTEEQPPLQSELEDIVDELEEKVMGRVVDQSDDRDQADGEDDADEQVAPEDESTEAPSTDEPAD